MLPRFKLSPERNPEPGKKQHRASSGNGSERERYRPRGTPPGLSSLWTETFRITSYLVDARKELSLWGLLSLIQENAWEHAEAMGYGYAGMLEVGQMWALVRQKVRMESWPRWGEKLRVVTWLRPLEGIVVTRDFEFWHEERQIGAAAAAYLMLDVQSRRPTPPRMPHAVFRADGRGPLDPGRIPPREHLPVLARFSIRYTDLDMYSHVNNTRFGQWIMDAVPPSAHESQTLCGYEVDFLAEVRAQDRVAIEAGPEGAGLWHFQGRREGDDKVVFTALLEVAR